MSSRFRTFLPPVFVPLFAAYPVLFIASANPGQVQIVDVVGVAGVAVLAALMIWAALRTLGRSAESAAVAVAFLVCMFFVYGQFANWLDGYVLGLGLGDFATPNALDLHPHMRTKIALAWGGIALLASVLIARSVWARKPELVKALGWMSAGLVLFALFRIGIGLRHEESTAKRLAETVPTGSAQPAAGRPHPDIYFIVLDGYARQDVLAGYYGFDNGPFLQALRDRGFQVSTGGSSNYAWTFLSLSSTLNMGYIHDLFAGRLGPDSLDRSLLYDSIRDSETARFLRGQGYEVVHVRSTWGATSVNPAADREIRCESSAYNSEFVRAVAEASWLGAFNTKAGFDLARCHLANFKSVGQIRPDGRPMFVFAHFLLPHHPYLFDRNGKILRNAMVSNQFEFQKRLWEDRDSYRSQLEFLNRKVLEMVDALQHRSAAPPIIVIVSDHGPGITNGLTQAAHYAVRFANFGAYSLPGAPPDLMPPSGTAVNQFRRILSFYFDAKLSPLPDRHFASPYGMPYAFREVPHELLQQWWTEMPTEPQPAVGNDAASPIEEESND